MTLEEETNPRSAAGRRDARTERIRRVPRGFSRFSDRLVRRRSAQRRPERSAERLKRRDQWKRSADARPARGDR